MKRLSKVKIEWSANFSYAIGLMATDGCLSKDGRHMDITSKDEELIVLFKKCFEIQNATGLKRRMKERERKYYRVQFGDKNFYDFLLGIGITPAKSKTLGSLKIPDSYFADFLRGCIDGDGNIQIVRHPESKHIQLRTRISSASLNFLNWIKEKVNKILAIDGGYIWKGKGVWVLTYAKADSVKLLNFIYYSKEVPYLMRKRIIAMPFLRI